MTKKIILILSLTFSFIFLAGCWNKDLTTDLEKDLTWDTQIIDKVDYIVDDLIGDLSEDSDSSEVWDPGTSEAVDLMDLNLLEDESQESEDVWLANPASTYCIENWWELEMRNSDAWQYWVCKFDNWNECEERAFFRGECVQ